MNEASFFLLPSFFNMQTTQIRKNWITRIIVIQAIILLIIGLLTLRKTLGTHDLNLYYRSSLYLLQGKLPYRDFDLEYPPFALVAFIIPRILTLGLTNNSYIYAFFFVIQNVFFSSINTILLLKIISKSNFQLHKILALISYTLFAVIVSPVMLWRYDLFPTLLTVLALVTVISFRPTFAGIFLGFGIAAKLYPVILLPVFSVYYFANRSYRAILNLWLATVGTVFLIFLPLIITSHGKFFYFLNYHKERGLQIESFSAGIISLIHKFGFIEAKTVAGYGSRNIVSSLNDIILSLLPWLLIVLYSVMLINCFCRFREDPHENQVVKNKSLVAYSLLALLIFIITSKVFSPQYIVWIVPFTALLKPRQLILMLGICLTTYIMMTFGSFRNLDFGKILWLNLRNVLVLGLGIWVFLDYLPGWVNLRLRRN
jgi:uncharacterized membrane protein